MALPARHCGRPHRPRVHSRTECWRALEARERKAGFSFKLLKQAAILLYRNASADSRLQVLQNSNFLDQHCNCDRLLLISGHCI